MNESVLSEELSVRISKDYVPRKGRDNSDLISSDLPHLLAHIHTRTTRITIVSRQSRTLVMQINAV